MYVLQRLLQWEIIWNLSKICSVVAGGCEVQIFKLYNLCPQSSET
jgi:hypothetical protein